MLAFLAPYRLLIEVLAIGALLASIAFGIHRFLEHEQDIGYQRAVAEYTAKQLVAEDAARVKEHALQSQLETAQNAAAKRDQTNQTLAAAAAASSVGLRDTVAALRNGLPAATAAAARATADALGTVFGQCADRYQRLAEIADRHASESQTLRDAWPVIAK